MAYTDKFNTLMGNKKFPQHYDVYPITEEPYLQNVPRGKNLSWIVAIEPALDVPGESYFQRAGQQQDVEITNLISIRGDLAMFYQLVRRGVTPETIERDKERLWKTIGFMSTLANVWEDPEATANVLFLKEGTVRRRI